MNESQASRRHFLQVLAVGTVGTAGICALGCSSASSAAEPTGTVSAGNVKDLPVDTLRAVAGEPAAIGRDAQGVYALSLVCTHQQCDIAMQGVVAFTGIMCTCHGSRFDANGQVLSGPASAPLPHYAVSIDATGAITIDFGTVVGAAVRTQAA